MPAAYYIEIGLVGVMIFVPLIVIHGRMRLRPKDDESPRGIGVRIIQLLSLFLLIPLIGVLTLEGKISGDTTGALLGVAAGYTLSGLEKPVPTKD